jgi:hypothetical protein
VSVAFCTCGFPRYVTSAVLVPLNRQLLPISKHLSLINIVGTEPECSTQR